MNTSTERAPVQLQRGLNLFDTTMVVIGGIIGSGIFINPYLVARLLERPNAIAGVWLFGGLLASIGALAYAELGVLIPAAGGQYVYLSQALHPLIGFLYGWTLLLVIETGAMAAVAYTFAEYASALAGRHPSQLQLSLLAVAAITLLSVVNYCGLRPGARVQDVFTALRVAVLASLVALAFFGHTAATTLSPEQLPHLDVGVLLAAMVPILFTYGGWQNMNYVAGEVREPQYNIPRAQLLGTGAVVMLYVAVNVGYVRVLGPAGLASTTTPASTTAMTAVGAWGSRLIAFGIACSTFGFLNLAVLAAPRVYYAMALDGLFFERAARLHPRFQVPGFSIVVQSIWAAVLLLDVPRYVINAFCVLARVHWRAPAGTYARLLSYVVFADWIFFGLSVTTLFVFRHRGLRATFRTPGYPWLPALFILSAAGVVVNTIYRYPVDTARGIVLILTGVPVFFWWQRKSHMRGQPAGPDVSLT